MNICRILIVDDDATMRIALKSLIAWKQHGYELIGEAADGKSALDIAKVEFPHIIITDMKMPVMDGLTLIRKIYEEGLHPVFLVLSSYDDFELVKSALKLGAFDYLLKVELESTVLLNCLNEARNQITADPHQVISHRSRLEKQNRLLKDILCNIFYSESEMKLEMEACGMCFDTLPIYCFFIKAGDLYKFEENTEEEYDTFRFSVLNVVTEIVQDCFDAYCVEGKTGEFYVLASLKKFLTDESPHSIMVSTVRRIQEMLRQYLNLPCVIGISEGGLSLKELKLSCRQASEAVRTQYYMSRQDIIEWKDCHTPIQQDLLMNDRVEVLQAKQQLKNALLTLNLNDTVSSLRQFSSLICATAFQLNMILFLVLEIFICVQEVFDQFGIESKIILKKSWKSYYFFLSIQDTKKAQLWINDLITDLTEYIHEENNKEYRRIIERAKKIIHRYYSEKLSLTYLANEVHLNPSYLSTLMKKYIGMNYSEYLTYVRIEAAKQMLTNSDEKISVIASQVGYDDQFYFNRLFKRTVGISPGEYRKRTGRQEKSEGGTAT